MERRSGVLGFLMSATSLGTQQARAQEGFAGDVRATPWLSPEDERKALHVPEGFEITCFAHEPDLWKPMNVAFDARGRLWCTSSTEYPYAVKADREFKGRDKITIHEDTDGDGVADKLTVFADDLNIPIGLYPCVDREGHDGAIVFSIPNIWRLDDTDGDGRADQRKVLYGPMGWERDTHGLHNSFRRGFDGWVYANHGYNNHTKVKGTDGHEVEMQSGNTYRFRMDGSRIEQFTYGQVNPFGSCFDERGDLYTADCHTLPITVLVRGGCYESFGRPHDGVGFTPQVMKHLHGSTALCGLAIATGDSGDQFPAEYQGDLFVGNVMSCRVHRDKLAFDGSTPRALEQPDFITSDDPWFRPVDLMFGPDGALYVADFYNRIIGHYEVPLEHPGRDRTSGRIWRVAWVGKDGRDRKAVKAPDLRAMTADQLVDQFASPNLTVRMRALDELTDRADYDEAMTSISRSFGIPNGARAESMMPWVVLRMGQGSPFTPATERKVEFQEWRLESSEPMVWIHMLRVLAEDPTPHMESTNLTLLRELAARDPFVRRAAAEAIGRRAPEVPLNPEMNFVRALLELLAAVDSSDPLLVHTARIALRNRLRESSVFPIVESMRLGARSRRELLSICLALSGSACARYLIDHIEDAKEPEDDVAALLAHAARNASPEDRPRLVALVRRRYAFDVARQLALLEPILEGLDRGEVAPDPSIVAWAEALSSAVLTKSDPLAPPWRNGPVPGAGKSANPWGFETRRCSDGTEASMLSSLPGGEVRTGALRSQAFTLPAKLAFLVAGHNDEPERPAIPFNKVRVVDAASGTVLAECLAPRNDVAQSVEFDLGAASAAGKQGYVELVDANPYDAYAWIAAGRFEPPVAALALPERAPAGDSEQTLAALRLATRFASDALGPKLRALALATTAEPAVRAAAAKALIASAPSPAGSALAELIDDPDAPAELCEPICAAIASGDSPKHSDLAALALRGIEICPARQQLPLALALARTQEGATKLLELVKLGKASAALLVKQELHDAITLALANETPDGATRLAELTKSVPSEDATRARLLSDRRRSFARHGGDADAGARLFTKNCAICHRLEGAGAIIGPQLDGIGARGFERLIEDVLDPNRNVDFQFVRTNVFLKGGEVMSVLVRRTEGGTLVYADETGKEQRLPVRDIEKQRASRLSLMPDNYGETFTESEFCDLVAFLLAPANATPARSR